MPLRFATEPANGAALIREGLKRISARTSPLSERGVDFGALQLSEPHAVYDLRADAVAGGGGLASANHSGFRYLIESDGSAVAAAEVQVDTTGSANLLAHVNYGPYVEATDHALAGAASLEAVSAGSYEVRVLRFAAISLMALWLKPESDGVDIIYPMAPPPSGLEAERAYSEEEFIQSILPLAQKRASGKGQGVVP